MLSFHRKMFANQVSGRAPAAGSLPKFSQYYCSRLGHPRLAPNGTCFRFAGSPSPQKFGRMTSPSESNSIRIFGERGWGVRGKTRWVVDRWKRSPAIQRMAFAWLGLKLLTPQPPLLMNLANVYFCWQREQVQIHAERGSCFSN